MQGDDPLILTLARGHYCPKRAPAAPRALRDAWEAGDYSRFHGWDEKAATAPGAP
jgi:hypothetical protein